MILLTLLLSYWRPATPWYLKYIEWIYSIRNSISCWFNLTFFLGHWALVFNWHIAIYNKKMRLLVSCRLGDKIWPLRSLNQSLVKEEEWDCPCSSFLLLASWNEVAMTRVPAPTLDHKMQRSQTWRMAKQKEGSFLLSGTMEVPFQPISVKCINKITYVCVSSKWAGLAVRVKVQGKGWLWQEMPLMNGSRSILCIVCITGEDTDFKFRLDVTSSSPSGNSDPV